MAKLEKLVRNVFNLITNLVTRNNLNYRIVVKMGAKDKIKRGDSKKSTSKPSKYEKYVCFTNTENKCMPTYHNLSVAHVNN